MRILLVAALLPCLALGQEWMMESVVPALAYGGACTSFLELRNLGDRPAEVEVEGHRASGAMVGLAGGRGMAVRLAAGQRASYQLDVAEETSSAWAKVRERVAAERQSPVVAVSASTECLSGNQLRTVSREVAFPTRNPWFSSDVARLRDGTILLINASERVARAAACYSSGDLYSVPEGRLGGILQPVCITEFEVQVPRFGSREFPVSRDGSSYFLLRTLGNSIVLQMLRPVEGSARIYAVDSTIHFGGEVTR